MNKKNKIIIFSLFILICISLSIIIFISKSNKNITNKALNGLAVYVYDEDEEDYIADDEIPTGSYTLNTTSSYCKGNGEIGEYDSTNGTISYTFTSSDQCYLYFDLYQPVLLGSNGFYITSGTNINEGVTQLLTKDTVNLSEDDYDNVRFIGANPNNYVCFEDDSNPGNCINYTKGSTSNASGGLFRIIGVFNEDTHGQSGEQLVKLISADSLGSMPWDYKQSGVGSSTHDYGSNDWSDSQLMYMLNGSEGNNKGYQTLTPVYGTTTPIRTLTYSNNNVYYDDTNSYYFYTNYSGYSYLSGSTTSSRQLNKPSSVSNGSNYSSSKITVNSLVPSQTSMIKEVVWHLGGYSSYSIKTSEFYTYERGTTTCYSAGKCTTTPRPTTWIGKIGLMYPSDYGYATSGGTTYDRNTCLTSYNLGIRSSYSDCYTNDWLLYPGSRTGTQGTTSWPWTISPLSSNAYYVFYVGSAGGVGNYSASISSGVCPAFYLESEVYVTGGDGTSSNPYRISITSSTFDNNTQQKVTINNLTSNGLNIKADIYSYDGLSSFGISTSNTTAPTTWITGDDNGTLSGTIYNLSYTASSEGTYYLWVKDVNGNKIVSGESVILTIPSVSSLEFAGYEDEYWDESCADYFTIGNVTGSILLDGSASIYTGDTIDFEDTDGGAEWGQCAIYFCENESDCINGSPDEAVGYEESDSLTISSNMKYYYLYQSCLTEDTYVWVYDDKRKKKKKIKVKYLKKNMKLLNYSMESNELEYNEITNIKVSEAKELYFIHIKNEIIKCSKNHTFFIGDNTILRACELQEGMKLLSENGESYEISKIERIMLDKPVLIYSISTNKKNKYCISNLKILSYAAVICLLGCADIDTVDAITFS